MIMPAHIRHSAMLMVLIGALVSSALIVSVSAYMSIDVGTAYGMITGGAYPNLVILDVRTKSEYDGAHIYSATLMPVTELQARIGELASHIDDPILVYCGSGGRSKTASGILDSNGFSEVYNMLGGITAWNSAGYPTWIGTVHNVNTTYNYDTIQAAIDCALTTDHDAILVDSGLYREHLVVSKTLSIIGTDPRNTVIDGDGAGTAVSVSANNVKIKSFTIRNSSESGIRLIGGNYAQIQGNKITDNYCGINISSSYNMISNNDIVGNQHYGVLVKGGSSTIFENNITSNTYGICVNTSQTSNSNLIYHNNLDNTYQAVANKAAGLWDGGYPSGGNYWSDYDGTDLFSGEYQTVKGSDGIGDTAHTIDSNNTDRYPLIRRWLWGPRDLTIISTGGGTTSPAPGSFTYNTTAYVEVTAIAYEHFIFDHWELDGCNASETPIAGVRTDTNHTMKAVFTLRKYALEIMSTGGGELDPPAGTYLFAYGTEVPVRATSNPGYFLDSWELDSVYVGISNPEIVTVDKNHMLQAVFRPLETGHNIATKWVASKSVAGQGFNLSIQVTVLNTGSYAEIFNVTTYVDATIIKSENITLLAGNSTIVSFVWNTIGFAYGSYTISAYAWPVPDEAHTEDNTFVDGGVFISIPGDINGDKTVDLKDVFAVGKAFGSTRLGPNPIGRTYVPNCDLNDDGKIDLKDYFATCMNYGKSW